MQHLAASMHNINMSKFFNIIDQVEVGSPCPIDKSKLSTNNLGDYCKSCEKQVYDFRKLSKLQIARLIKKGCNNTCIQIQKDNIGKLITRERIISHEIKYKLQKLALLVPIFSTTLFVQESKAQDEFSNYQNYTFEAEYGDALIPRDINTFLIYLEGALGALVMLSSFLISMIFLIVFYGTRKKKHLYTSLGLLLLSFIIFLMRGLVVTFFNNAII